MSTAFSFVFFALFLPVLALGLVLLIVSRAASVPDALLFYLLSFLSYRPILFHVKHQTSLPVRQVFWFLNPLEERENC